jgi:hypothetical protein
MRQFLAVAHQGEAPVLRELDLRVAVDAAECEHVDQAAHHQKAAPPVAQRILIGRLGNERAGISYAEREAARALRHPQMDHAIAARTAMFDRVRHGLARREPEVVALALVEAEERGGVVGEPASTLQLRRQRAEAQLAVGAGHPILPAASASVSVL